MMNRWIAASVVLLLLVGAGSAPATMYAPGTPVADPFSYLGVSPFFTKWDPGPDTASFHAFVPPAGPMLPGATSYSVMPAGTLSDAFDGPAHGGAGIPTVGGGAGTVIVGAGAGGEMGAYAAALATWSAATGGNLTILPLVPDGGAAFNTPEPVPGSNTIFGDIRIGTIAMDGPLAVLAHAFQPGTAATFGGTPSIGGDAHFDTAEVWIDAVAAGANPPGTFDYHTVVLHEFGHSLGLGHSTDPLAVMFPFYPGVRRALGVDDIAGIVAIYGFREGGPGPDVIPEPSTIMVWSLLLALGLIASRRRKA